MDGAEPIRVNTLQTKLKILGEPMNRGILFLGALIAAFLLFYTMDHLVMSMQGLPLNLDLTPAQ